MKVCVILVLCWLIESYFASSIFSRQNSTNYLHRKGALLSRWAESLFSSHQSVKKPHPDYPRPQLVRKTWLNLNGLWDITIIDRDNINSTEKILVPFPIESTLSGISRNVSDVKKIYYQRYFTLPKRWRDQRIILHFGAVDWKATVYVNGVPVCSHAGGYSSFSIDITSALNNIHRSLGSPSKRQQLLVKIEDPTDTGTQPRGKQVVYPKKIWYTSITGIWQTVWLEMVLAMLSIDNIRIIPHFDNASVEIQIACIVDPRVKPEEDYVLEINIGANNESSLYHLEESFRFSSQFKLSSSQGLSSKVSVNRIISLPEFVAWSPSNPFLYDVRIGLSHRDDYNISQLVDEVASYFGMRKISLKQSSSSSGATMQIHLNNKNYFQMGLLDQGFWPDGLYTAPTDEALKYDIEISKKLGFNMIRKHVKVEPARWYYWCDVLGMLVWQDMPSGDRETARYVGPDIVRTETSSNSYYNEWKEIVQQLWNHPSIVVWIPFNEGWGQFDTEQVTAFTRKLDSTRLIDAVSGWIDRGTGDIIDVHNYPQPIAPQQELLRASVLGEYGGLGLYIPGHSWSARPTWSYKKITDTVSLTNEFLRLLHMVKDMRDHKGLCAAIYTQTTDVEGEINGLMTYDRELIKLEVLRVQPILLNMTGEY